ncbi:MAG: hypothetical protein K5765_08685 [Clostridia bacterium]|nr:hypothetical protein [Clostridia bacterium]
MEEKELLALKENINKKLAVLEKEILETLDDYDYSDTPIDDLFLEEIPFETTVNQRYFENLLQTRKIELLLLEKIDDILSASNDKNKRHTNVKSIEELISFIRSIKHESEQAIDNENHMLKSMDDSLSVLKKLRTNL